MGMRPEEVIENTPEQTPAIGSSGAEARGLTDAEATRRLAQFGENALAEHRVSVLHRLAQFFWGTIPRMIEAAAVLSAGVRHWADLAIIEPPPIEGSRPDEHRDPAVTLKRAGTVVIG